MNPFASTIIHKVHDEWKQHEPLYKHGYAVFYGKVNPNPSLLFIGLNPGGNQVGLDWKADALNKLSEEQDYIRYAQQADYPLAQRTYQLFEEIGQRELLSTSVKTNLVFFRSPNWKVLPKKAMAMSLCQPIVKEIIHELRPRVLLCESIAVLDWVVSFLNKEQPLKRVQMQKRGNRRKYVSLNSDKDHSTAKVIGITHLSGSRPSREDLNEIKRRLSADLMSVL